MPQPDRSRQHHAHGGPVDEGVVIAGANHRQVVGVLAHPAEQVGDLQARLPIFPEGPPGPQQLHVLDLDELQVQVLGDEAGRDGLAVKPAEQGLGIEAVHLTGAALHIQTDDTLGLGREVRRPGSQWIDGSGRPHVPQGMLAIQQVAQGQASKAEAGGGQKLSPRPYGHLPVAATAIHWNWLHVPDMVTAGGRV